MAPVRRPLMIDPSVREQISHAPTSILRLASGRCIAVYDPRALRSVVKGEGALVADRSLPKRRLTHCVANFRRWRAFGAIVLATWIAIGMVTFHALHAIFGQ